MSPSSSSSSFPSSPAALITTTDKFAKIPNTNFTVQFVIDQLNSADANCPKIWQINADKYLDSKVALQCLAGTGFLSTITRIIFTFTNSREEFSTILKVPTAAIIGQKCRHFGINEIQEIASLVGTYHRIELAFYTQIVPKYFRHVPKLSELIAQIYAHSDTFILMEDLAPKGAHRNGAIDANDEKMVESVVEAMALLHAHSLAIPSEVLETVFKPQKTLFKSKLLLNSMTHQRICSMPDPMGPYFRSHSDKLANFLQSTNSGPQIERAIAHHLGTDVPVLCHGDLWVNNLVFDRFDGRIRGILDWQFAHYGNGISDIAHFLLNGVNAELRKRCTSGWLRLYHRTFVKHSRHSDLLPTAGGRAFGPSLCLEGRGQMTTDNGDNLTGNLSSTDHLSNTDNLANSENQPNNDNLSNGKLSNSGNLFKSDNIPKNDNLSNSDNRVQPDRCHKFVDNDGDNGIITLQQVQTLYAAVLPCHLHSELSIEALLYRIGEPADEENNECPNKLRELIWQRICDAFDEFGANFN